MKGGLTVRVVGTTVVHLVATPPVAAKILPGPVLLLVGSAAGLLEGDSLRLQIDLAADSQLEVRTTAATIAHPCVDGGSTDLEIDCRLGSGARLAWLPEPLIACGGCHHRGRARLSLGSGAAIVWLDMLSLGRTGETAGQLEQRLDVELDGRPLLREGLRVGGAPSWDGPAVVGENRHVAALHLLGRRVPSDTPGVMQLAGPGSTARMVAHRGDELCRDVAAALPVFLQALSATPAQPAQPAQPPKEAVHV